jgi:hypothetical protein
VGWA